MGDLPLIDLALLRNISVELVQYPRQATCPDRCSTNWKYVHSMVMDIHEELFVTKEVRLMTRSNNHYELIFDKH